MKRLMVLLSMCLLFVGQFQAEGFVAGIVIHTQQGDVPIEQLCNGECVIFNDGNKFLSYEIADVTSNIVDYCIKITAQDVVVCVAPDQKLYVLGKNWVRADELILSDMLLCSNKKVLSLNAINVIHEQCKMYALSVQESHLYCVTPYGIIVHNAEPIGTTVVTTLAFICPPAAAAVAIGEILALGAIGFGAYLIHKKSKQENQQNRYPINTGDPGNCPYGGKPPKHEDDKDEHPNGIYEDAGYHHFNSYGKKSPCPNNGQKCLDKSFPIGKKITGRISIEDGKFVVLRQSATGKFHGYVIDSWKELCDQGSKTQLIRNAFQKHGLVNKAGKIIKNII
ncbi:MAG TPA: polymorphic toxin-type HINT domain-containing protein [Candidatus Babeliales bacterium]|nr:polymorphic toxin-type HINT domain-containing protein [Candidatus Babeliales bacterium]